MNLVPFGNPSFLNSAFDGYGATARGAFQSVRNAVVPESVRCDVKWVLGPWLETYGIGSDDSARIDDAPDFSKRLAGPQGPGVSESPASREGTALIGIELGLARFLALDLEAVSQLGRAYVAGSVDFAKAKGEIFGGLILETPDIAFDNWRYSGDPSFEIGLRLGAQLLVELIGAHYEVGYDTPPIPMFDRELPLEFTGRLDAAVHAFARVYAEGSIGSRNALVIGGKAFAGASTTLAGQVELASLAGAHGSVTGWAGAGAEFSVGVVADFEEGEYGVTNSAGVAVGVGASYDYGVSVHPGEIFAATELPGRVPQIWDQFAQRVEGAGRSALAGEISPAEFGTEFVSASGQALGQVAAAVDDSLP